jgi:hypothetical protein
MTPRSRVSILGRDAVLVSQQGAHLVPTAIGRILDVQRHGNRSGIVMELGDGREVIAYWHEVRLLV